MLPSNGMKELHTSGSSCHFRRMRNLRGSQLLLSKPEYQFLHPEQVHHLATPVAWNYCFYLVSSMWPSHVDVYEHIGIVLRLSYTQESYRTVIYQQCFSSLETKIRQPWIGKFFTLIKFILTLFVYFFQYSCFSFSIFYFKNS